MDCLKILKVITLQKKRWLHQKQFTLKSNADTVNRWKFA